MKFLKYFPEIKILEVGKHMKKQSDCCNFIVPLQKNGSKKIQRNHWISVQQMIADTVSVGIENWVGKNMIEVNQHGSQHDEIGFLPVISEKNQGNEKRRNEMKKVMDDLADVK